MKLDLSKIMLKRLVVTGSTLRNRDVAFKGNLAREVEKHVFPLFEDGRIRPLVNTVMPLDRAADAHRLMESNKHIGKIVLSADSNTT